MAEDVGLVVGRGLIGGWVETVAPNDTMMVPSQSPRPWDDHSALDRSFRADIRTLFEHAARHGARWRIFWTAGIGHLGASDEQMAAESDSLRLFLKALADATGQGAFDRPGVFVFASSAGAVYGGGREWPANEESPPVPVGAYGHHKLDQERLIDDALDGIDSIRVCHSRVSTVYGSGQSTVKPQGVITHLIRNSLLRTPSRIYVPLDTKRDFIHARSVAAMLHAHAAASLQPGASNRTIRLAAAERSVTLAQVIGTIRRVGRRPVPYVLVSGAPSPAQLSFRSIERHNRLIDTMTLDEGIGDVINDMRLAVSAGR